MPDKITAPSKINLHLAITGVLENGYHELDTLFVPLYNPADTLEISVGEKGFHLECPGHPELENESNLLHKAWKAFGEATGFQPDLDVILYKKTPMGAGLGGGSSDAAALLNWLNAHAENRALAEDKLNALAAKLGADVPFFLKAQPALATGIGDKLVAVDLNLSGYHCVVVCPGVHVNTAWAYRKWDEINASKLLTTDRADYNNSARVSGRMVFNDFESVVFPEHPLLRNIRNEHISLGAEAAAMSGSGSSVFGLYRNEKDAQKAAEQFGSEGHEIFTYIF